MSGQEFGQPVDWLLSLCALASLGLLFWPGNHHRKNRIRAVMGFLVFGMFITLIWLRLNSVDVALAEAALGGGFLGAIMVYLAVATKDSEPETSTRAGTAVSWAAAGLGLATILGISVLWLEVDQQLPQWRGLWEPEMHPLGLEHPVTGVLLAFRAYDTLLETGVVLFAGIAVWVLAQSAPQTEPADASTPPGKATADEGSPDTLPDTGREPIIRMLMRILTPVVLLIALWLIFVGSSDSGGAFQAGVVIAAGVIGVHISGISQFSLNKNPPAAVVEEGTRPEGPRFWILPSALTGGVFAFLTSAAIGPLTGTAWFSLESPWAFPVILGVEILLSIGIGAALSVIYLALEPRAQHCSKQKGAVR